METTPKTTLIEDMALTRFMHPEYMCYRDDDDEETLPQVGLTI